MITANVSLNIGFVMANLIAKMQVMREKCAELDATIVNGNVTTDYAFRRVGSMMACVTAKIAVMKREYANN